MNTTIKLKSGYEMPLVGLGCWQIEKIDIADQVYNAIKSGYRLVDEACDYGNEVECGQGISRAIKDGLVERKDIFVTSKLWNTFHAPEHVMDVCKKQLADFGLDYFDLYLIHFPISLKYVPIEERYPPGWANGETEDVPLHKTWEAMEELVKAGLVRSIGVSNYQGGLILDLLRYAKIPCSVLQIEHHPYLAQEPLVQLCKQFGIAITAYSSYGPASFVKLDMDRKVPALLENNTISGIANKHGKSPAQVLLRWSTQRGIAVIPRSKKVARLKENLDNTTFDLSPEDIKSISSLNENIRFNDPGLYMNPPIPIFA